MIIRIATEGQYRIGGKTLSKVGDIDDRLLAAMHSEDKAEFSKLLGSLIDVVRKEGQPIPIDEIVESDLVLPPPDTSLEEARRLLTATRAATRL